MSRDRFDDFAEISKELGTPGGGNDDTVLWACGCVAARLPDVPPFWIFAKVCNQHEYFATTFRIKPVTELQTEICRRIAKGVFSQCGIEGDVEGDSVQFVGDNGLALNVICRDETMPNDEWFREMIADIVKHLQEKYS